jgi:hypothetical protein
MAAKETTDLKGADMLTSSTVEPAMTFCRDAVVTTFFQEATETIV